MPNGRKTNTRNRQQKPAGSLAGHAQQWTSSAPRQQPQGSHNARRNYERYLALAQAEVQAGDRVAAENYYQHAEHYFRSMSSEETRR
jgi:uncharacterized protein DUF4167